MDDENIIMKEGSLDAAILSLNETNDSITLYRETIRQNRKKHLGDNSNESIGEDRDR